MTYLSKGANAPVPTAPLRVAVGRADVPGTPAVDASALLLDAAGRVRGDADLVFHNQPRHPSGAVRHAGLGQGAGQSAEWLELDLPNVEAAVQRVVIAGSCDGGTFGQVPGLYVQTVAPDGTVAAHYAVTDAAEETAFVLGEFYRRDGAWKFRAVGQGYASGLAGLATDFGVEVAGAAPVVAGVAVAAPAPLAPVPLAPAPSAPAPLAPAPAAPAPVPAGPVLNTAVSKTSGPPPAQPLVPTVPTVPTTGASPLGPDFTPYVRSGKGNDVVTVEVPLPRGPVIVEARVEGESWLCVETLDRDNKEDKLVFNATVRDLHGRALVQPPADRPLRLRVKYSGEWTLSVLPLAAARPLGTRTLHGRGPDVLLYTGTSGDVRARFDGGADRDAWFLITGHRIEHLDDLERNDLLVNDTGKLKETFPVPDGPHVLVVERGDGDWRLEPRPLPVRDPAKGRRTGVYQGRGEKTITLVNPRPGRPALLRYDFPGAERGYDLEMFRIDEYGDETGWLNGRNNGIRGTATVFAKGQAEIGLRIKHKGEWTLEVLPEEDAPLFTGPVEGQGTSVLRYQGPPALMSLSQLSYQQDRYLAAHAVNHPFGNTAIIADLQGRRRPALGPVWVDPGGTCFLLVVAADHTKWRLEPQPLKAATPLGRRTQGVGYGVVHHTGPDTEISFVCTSGIHHLFQLDENLFPRHKVTGSSDPHRISEGILQVRALGEWTIELRG
ncbi:TerD family protein [Streptomyces sp. NPDC056716]|uniref:TerD family protein n=1 Tax=unclassified Streptomyces TaxID=2593676 RepID=UPI0036B6B52B